MLVQLGISPGFPDYGFPAYDFPLFRWLSIINNFISCLSSFLGNLCMLPKTQTILKSNKYFKSGNLRSGKPADIRNCSDVTLVSAFPLLPQPG